MLGAGDMAGVRRNKRVRVAQNPGATGFLRPPRSTPEKHATSFPLPLFAARGPMADAPEGAPPAEEGAKQVAKRRKPKKEAPEATKFVEADVVETVLTLPADKLRIDEDKTHGQVHLRPGWGPPFPQPPLSVVPSGWVPHRNTSSPCHPGCSQEPVQAGAGARPGGRDTALLLGNTPHRFGGARAPPVVWGEHGPMLPSPCPQMRLINPTHVEQLRKEFELSQPQELDLAVSRDRGVRGSPSCSCAAGGLGVSAVRWQGGRWALVDAW